MPTNHDETLAERYMRELQTELAIYSRMTPEQIGAMAVDLHNALAERDSALAELAALKGGQEAATNRKTWSPRSDRLQLPALRHCARLSRHADVLPYRPSIRVRFIKRQTSSPARTGERMGGWR